MGTYIAFLRGINVSGQKKVPMAELRSLLSKKGFDMVRTYIQSGNVVFESKKSSLQELRENMETVIEKHFGFKVPVLIKAEADIRHILNNNPYNNEDDLESNRIYFVLLFQYPEEERITTFNSEEYPNEEWQINGDCLYLLCKEGYGNAKVNNNLVERKLKVDATTRNYRTMQKLLDLADVN